MKKIFFILCLSLVCFAHAKTEPEAITIRDIKIEIPEDYGRVVDSFGEIGDDGRVIVCVQDAHCHYEAQMNIYQILKKLDSKFGIKLISVEGSEGALDTSPFTSFNDPELIDQTAQYFMKKGLITGPEYFAILKQSNPDAHLLLYGIEDRDVYQKNLKAFNDSLPFRDRSKKIVEDLSGVVSILKRRVYSENLQKLDTLSQNFSNDAVTFTEYCHSLAVLAQENLVDISSLKNFNLILETEKLGKSIDSDKVTKQQTTYVDTIQKKLSKEELSKLVLMTLSYRLKKITATEYFSFLQETANDKGIILEIEKTYPQLAAYIGYVELFDRIDKDALFGECKRVEEKIAAVLFQNQDQKDLYRITKEMGIISRIFLLLLERDDYLYLKKYRQNFRMGKIVATLTDLSKRYDVPFSDDEEYYQIDSKLPIVETFYDTATDRDMILAERAIQQMSIENAGLGVMVTGGFHTKGITHYFRQEKIPYIIIAPIITEEHGQDLYLKVMSDKRTPVEEFFTRFGE